MLAAPLRPGTPEGQARRVVVYTANEHDQRLEAVGQAAAFWNQTLSTLTLPQAFLEPRVVVSARETRTLQTYATRVSKDGWKDDAEYAPGTAALAPPPEVTSLSGDVLVLLSTQPILSFAWPIGAGRYLVTIRSDAVPPLNTPSARRNVLAHEFGHTLGLRHNDEPTNLMCASCEMTVSRSQGSSFLPLRPEDLAWLAQNSHVAPPPSRR